MGSTWIINATFVTIVASVDVKVHRVGLYAGSHRETHLYWTILSGRQTVLLRSSPVSLATNQRRLTDGCNSQLELARLLACLATIAPSSSTRSQLQRRRAISCP